MDEYNKELCDERHGKITSEISCLFKKLDHILIAIIVTLLTVVGSLITIIATRPAAVNHIIK